MSPFLRWRMPWDLFCRSKSTARADLELGQVLRRVPVTPGPGLPCEDPGRRLLPGNSAHSPRCDRGQHLSVALPQPPRAQLLRVVSYWCTSPSPGETMPWAPDAPGAKHSLLSRPFPFSSLGLFSTCIQVSLNEKQPFPARRARSSFCKHHGVVISTGRQVLTPHSAGRGHWCWWRSVAQESPRCPPGPRARSHRTGRPRRSRGWWPPGRRRGPLPDT